MLSRKEKLLFSLKTLLIAALLGLIVNSFFLPSPNAPFPISLLLYILEYVMILSGPLMTIIEPRYIPLISLSLILSFISLILWIALLLWTKTKPYMLAIPLLLWIATGTWNVFCALAASV